MNHNLDLNFWKFTNDRCSHNYTTKLLQYSALTHTYYIDKTYKHCLYIHLSLHFWKFTKYQPNSDRYAHNYTIITPILLSLVSLIVFSILSDVKPHTAAVLKSSLACHTRKYFCLPSFSHNYIHSKDSDTLLLHQSYLNPYPTNMFVLKMWSALYFCCIILKCTHHIVKSVLYHPYQLFEQKISRDVQGLHWCRWYKIVPYIMFVQLYVR